AQLPERPLWRSVRILPSLRPENQLADHRSPARSGLRATHDVFSYDHLMKLGPDYLLSHGQASRVINSLRSHGRIRHRLSGSGRKFLEILSIRTSSVVSAVIRVELVKYLNFIVASAVSGHRNNDTIRTYNARCDGHHKKAQYLLNC